MRGEAVKCRQRAWCTLGPGGGDGGTGPCGGKECCGRRTSCAVGREAPGKRPEPAGSWQERGVRQEIDGSQAEHLGLVPCGQIVQNSRSERGAGPRPDKREKTTYSSFSRSRRPSQLNTHRKAP